MTGRPMTVDEVAGLMRVSPKTVMRAISAGQLEASRITQGRGGWRIRPEAVDAWLDARSNQLAVPEPITDVGRTPRQSVPLRRPPRPSRRNTGGTLMA
jgi:excisionase family DNA binding protein